MPAYKALVKSSPPFIKKPIEAPVYSF